MRSSYIESGFNDIFINTIFAFPPLVAVELGVLDGYSTMAIAEGLEKVERFKGSVGHLYSYDLWEDYEYNHGSMEEVRKLLKNNDLIKYVSLNKMDAYKVYTMYEDNSVDLIHIDISNDGNVLNKMIELWTPKIRHCGIFMFEGGSEERDQIEWMIKYNKKPIRPELNSNKIIQKNYIYGTVNKFPSLTIMKKVTL